MLTETVEKLKDFRATLYQFFFPKRRDAIFELMDANSTTSKCNSVVALSKSKRFRREYPSVTDALTDGLESCDWQAINKLKWCFIHESSQSFHRFVLDATPNSRRHAKKLKDKSIVYHPNPTPGNKPICVGHQYSVVSYMPEGNSQTRKTWSVPMSTQRVPSNQKSHEFGMKQLKTLKEILQIEDQLRVSIGDSAYSTLQCHKEVVEDANWVHITRLKSDRNVFELLPIPTNKSRGRPAYYGEKMSLNQPKTHSVPDDKLCISFTTKRGKPSHYEITAWNQKIVKGNKEFNAHKHPFRLIKIEAKDNGTDKAIFKKPIWLAIFGERRMEIPLIDCCLSYIDRYDIEHFNRFGKQNLRLDSFQTHEVEHEENWWEFVSLCYFQLYLARHMVKSTPEKWERYLPAFKQTSDNTCLSPAMTQRGFDTLLDQIGTPTKKPIKRGNPLGRKKGYSIGKKTDQPVIFKKKKNSAVSSQEITNDLAKITKKPNPRENQKAFQVIVEMLLQKGFSLKEFCDFALNSS